MPGRAATPGGTPAFLDESETVVEVRAGAPVLMRPRDAGLRSRASRRVARHTAPVEPIRRRVAEELRRVLAALRRGGTPPG